MPTRPAAELPATEPARKRTDVVGTREAEPARAAAAVHAPEPVDEDVPTTIVDPRTRPVVHRPDVASGPTPAAVAPESARERVRPAPLDSGRMAAVEIDAGDSAELERPRMSGFAIVVLVFLVLLATAVTVLSIVQKNTPDPRPLLEDIYRQLRG
jgi:hypothetical protein